MVGILVDFQVVLIRIFHTAEPPYLDDYRLAYIAKYSGFLCFLQRHKLIIGVAFSNFCVILKKKGAYRAALAGVQRYDACGGHVGAPLPLRIVFSKTEKRVFSRPILLEKRVLFPL